MCIQVAKEKKSAAEKQACIEKQRALDMARAGRFGDGEVRLGDSMAGAAYTLGSSHRQAGPPPQGWFGGRGAGDVEESGGAASAELVGHHGMSATVGEWGARGEGRDGRVRCAYTSRNIIEYASGRRCSIVATRVKEDELTHAIVIAD